MFLFIVSSTHDIHFSKSTIDYNEETKTLQVVINVFTDDLELAIERSHEGLDLEIGSENQHELTNSLVDDYAINQIYYTRNNEVVNFNFIGFEYDYDICYLYIESDTLSIEQFDKIMIGVHMFFEVYDDQENVVDISIPYYEDNLILNRKTPSVLIEINHR
jgi:hypothetical protein